MCNIKLRVEQYRIDHIITSQLLIQCQGLAKQEYDEPVARSSAPAAYGKLYRPCLLEQKTNVCDKISVEGPDIFSYKKLLDKSTRRYSL